MRLATSCLCTLCFTATACGDDDRGEDSAVSSLTMPTSFGDSEGIPPPQRLDVGGGAEGSGTRGGADDSANNPVCERVDVVLAVDNSSSMQEEIEALRGPVFDSFPQALLDVGNGLLDFHLGVIDGCSMPPALHDHGEGGPCSFSTDANYMISTSATLATEYACVTDLSNAGFMGMPDACSGDNDDEAPANTAAEVVTDAAGQNVGFLRNDAVLLVVAITDEDEQPVPDQTAQDIVDKIVAAKGGMNNVVFLGIGGGSLCAGPYGTALPATRLQEVSSIFGAGGRGLFWDLCDGDLTAAFEAAIEVVDSACNEFDPPEA